MPAKVLTLTPLPYSYIRDADPVADLIRGIESGSVKPGRDFDAAIAQFSCEELDRLCGELMYYYWQKFQ